MVRIIVSITLLLTLTSCKTKAPVLDIKTEEDKTLVLTPTEIQDSESIPYFKASGNEPFWNITIAETGIEFKSLIADFEDFKTPHNEPIKAMDANVKQYRIETASVQLNIQITQNDCVDSMSGDASPYEVSVELKHQKDTEFQNLKGCGRYLTDYRLHDIWVLETLNGNTVSVADFSKELPNLEINSNTNRFSGHAGCNRINGSLFYEKELLRFTNTATTMMMCTPQNKEDAFLKALQSSITYRIENNRLYLSNPSDTLLVFKKVD